MVESVFKKNIVVTILSSFAGSLGMMVDSIVTGSFLGLDAMASFGLSIPIITILAALGGMISSGAQTVCGNSLGRGNIKKLNIQFNTIVLTAFLISLAGMSLILFVPQLATVLGAEEGTDIHKLTVEYLRGYLLGAPAFVLMQVLMPFMQLDNDKKLAGIGALFMVLSDIIMDFVNVLVFHGGMFGMGLASSISYYVTIFILLTHFVKPDTILKLSFKKLAFSEMIPVFKSGFVYGIYNLSRTIFSWLFNCLLVSVGQGLAVAVWAVVSSISTLVYCITQGLGSATLLISSIYYAGRRASHLKDLIKCFSKYSVILSSIVMVVLMIFAEPLVKIFAHGNNDTIKLGAFALRAFALSYPFSSFNMCFRNYFQGIGRLLYCQLVCIGHTMVFPISAAYILAYMGGMNAIWFTLFVGEALGCVLLLLLAMVNRSHGGNAFLRPDDIIPDTDMREYNIVSSSDPISVSEDVYNFCIETGETKKRSMLASVCVEELGKNVVQYGMSDLSHKRHLFIRVLKSEGDLLLSLEDDCDLFDPVKFFASRKPDETHSGYGLRIVLGTVSDIKYLQTLSLNNISIRI